MKSKIICFDEILVYFYKTALYLAIEKKNIEIIKILLLNDNINVNIPYIPTFILYKIQNHIF